MERLLAVVLSLIYLFLTWFYGYLRYREGERAGITQGTAFGVEALFGYFKRRKVVDLDTGGNIFRVNDGGLRGETLLPNEKMTK